MHNFVIWNMDIIHALAISEVSTWILHWSISNFQLSSQWVLYLSLLQIISAITGGITDLSFDATGYAWQLMNCILTASYSVCKSTPSFIEPPNNFVKWLWDSVIFSYPVWGQMLSVFYSVCCYNLQLTSDTSTWHRLPCGG